MGYVKHLRLSAHASMALYKASAYGCIQLACIRYEQQAIKHIHQVLTVFKGTNLSGDSALPHQKQFGGYT